MKIKPVKPKNGAGGKPFEVAKVGNVSIPIYRHSNIIPQRDAAGKIIYGLPDATGKRSALVKYQSDIYTLAYYEGSKRIRQKFSSLEKAKEEAQRAATKIANGEIEALKLKSHDRSDYVRAMQKLQAWKRDADPALLSKKMRRARRQKTTPIFCCYASAIRQKKPRPTFSCLVLSAALNHCRRSNNVKQIKSNLA